MEAPLHGRCNTLDMSFSTQMRISTSSAVLTDGQESLLPSPYNSHLDKNLSSLWKAERDVEQLYYRSAEWKE